MFRYASLVVAVLVLLVACTDRPQTAGSTAAPAVSILVFGDSGYDTRYQEQKYFDDPLGTEEEFIADHRAWWARHHRPAEDFSVPPFEFHEPSGSYVPASGLMLTAPAMRESCDRRRCDFAVMLGDNIYPDGATLGADGVDDATRFHELFDRPFSALGDGVADFRIYTVLGNHDWHTSREGALLQLDYMEQSPKFYMDGLFYTVRPPSGQGSIELFAIDTEMLLASTDVRRAVRNEDGSEHVHDDLVNRRASAVPRTEDEMRMVDWLRDSLRESDADWKIVLAHHPMWSSGGEKFEQARAIRRLIRPIVCRYADAYLAGHEHMLELHEDSCADVATRSPDRPLIHLVSGAAAKQYDLHRPYMAAQDAAYPQRRLLFAAGMIWGFARIDIHDDTLGISFHTVDADGGGATEAFAYSFRQNP